MCGACGESESPMGKMIGNGAMAMMQKMPAMCGISGGHTRTARRRGRLDDRPQHHAGSLANEICRSDAKRRTECRRAKQKWSFPTR